MFCEDNRHLTTTVQTIIDDEGEGVILRKVRSLYECGRNSSLFKLKVFLSSSLLLYLLFLFIVSFSMVLIISQTAHGDREGIVVSIDDSKTVRLKLYVSAILLFLLLSFPPCISFAFFFFFFLFSFPLQQLTPFL